MKKFRCHQPYHTFIEVIVEAVDEDRAEEIAEQQMNCGDYEEELQINIIENGDMEIEEIEL